jgi:hypothetical protein
MGAVGCDAMASKSAAGGVIPEKISTWNFKGRTTDCGWKMLVLDK